jgi:4-hydroxy-tetrahydrodipicolinate synthase
LTPEVHVALLTPADEQGGVDEAALGAHVSWLAAAGVDGFLVAGTTGEAPLLDEGEIVRAVEATSERAVGRQVVAHVGRAATRESVRLARAASAAGATAVAAVTPYFFDYGDDQLLAHFSAVADAAAPLPLVAYTIPSRTHSELSPDLFERLTGIGVAWLKDSTKSLDRHHEYLDVARRHGGRVFMGSDGLALEALEAGASGLMSAVANVIPERVVALRDAVVAGEDEAAQALREEILTFRAETAQLRPMVALKERLAARLATSGGHYPTAMRLPLG